MSKTNMLRPQLRLVCSNSEASRKEASRVSPAQLTLVVNEDFSPYVLKSSRELASFIEREFLRLTVDCSIAKATRVRIDWLPEPTLIETAAAVLCGRNYLIEPHYQEARFPGDEPFISFWVEKRPH